MRENGSGRTCFTPGSNQLALVLEWRIVLRFPSHNASIYAWTVNSSRPLLNTPIAAIRVFIAQPHVQNLDGKTSNSRNA